MCMSVTHDSMFMIVIMRLPHVRCQVNFVDDQQIGAGDAWTTFARDFIASRNIDHVDKHVDIRA